MLCHLPGYSTGATVSDLGTVTTADIDGGTIDNTAIGGSTPSTGDFTNLTASVDVSAPTIDGDDITANTSLDATSATVDFTNAIIVLTSNVGARRVADFGTGIGFQSKTEAAQHNEKVDAIIKKELKNKFSPEFLNRLDEIILFDQLSEENILSIVDVELIDLFERMEEIELKVELDKTAKEFLAKEGYEPAYGARPLKRAIQLHVEDLIADAIISKKVKKGFTIFLVVN